MVMCTKADDANEQAHHQNAIRGTVNDVEIHLTGVVLFHMAKKNNIVRHIHCMNVM